MLLKNNANNTTTFKVGGMLYSVSANGILYIPDNLSAKVLKEVQNIPNLTVEYEDHRGLDLVADASNVTRLSIDKNRTDSYVETGSVNTPFKTIMGAINSIIDKGDNASDKPYLLDFVGAGTYVEDVVLNDLNLHNIVFRGNSIAKMQAATSDYALLSDTNNDNLKRLNIYDMHFVSDVKLEGATDGASVFSSDMNFYGCIFSGDVTGKNLVVFDIYESKVDANILIENVTIAILAGGQGQGPFRLDVNTVAENKKPAGFTQCYLIIERTLTLASTINISENSVIQLRGGVRLGHPATNLTIDGTLLSYGATLRPGESGGPGTIVISSTGNFNHALTSYNISALTNNGTITKLQDYMLESNGVSGSFTTSDGKTVNVAGGQITSIV